MHSVPKALKPSIEGTPGLLGRRFARRLKLQVNWVTEFTFLRNLWKSKNTRIACAPWHTKECHCCGLIWPPDSPSRFLSRFLSRSTIRTLFEGVVRVFALYLRNCRHLGSFEYSRPFEHFLWSADHSGAFWGIATIRTLWTVETVCTI